MSTGPQNGPPIGRRALPAGVARVAKTAGPAGLAGAAARAAAADGANGAASGRYPSNWPDLEPYGPADTRSDLWPREDW